jgi:T5SS/PEP-CTERM-associated repeat protein
MTSGRADRIHWRVVALCLLMLQSAAQPARAANNLWDNINGGFFSEPLNWFGGLPGSGDNARFEITDSVFFQRKYIVDFTANPTNQQLVVEDDDVTFVLFGHTYTLANAIDAVLLGTVPNRSGNLTLTGGTLSLLWQVTAPHPRLEIATVANATGVLTVGAGGRVIGSPDVNVGLNGNGTLNIQSGGNITADRVNIGRNSSATGTATVTGANSTLFAEDIIVGSGDALNASAGGRVESQRVTLNGELDVTAAGQVDAAISFITSGGVATVDGIGSTWDSASLHVGANGLGTLNITGGGRVTNQSADLGRVFPPVFETATGQVNVASSMPGAISVWTVTFELKIGHEFTNGTGTLLIQPGGGVDAQTTRLARGALLRLEGGTLATSEILFDAVSAQFAWVAGTLRVGRYNGNLTVPSGGVLPPAPRAVRCDHNRRL